MFERARQRAEAELADARQKLAAGDTTASLRSFERARRDFLGARDLAGLNDLRRTLEDAYRECDPKDEPLYEQLLYASAQNVRFLSRRRAAEAGAPWEDPHPELDDPSRPELRVERSVRRRDVPWIFLFGAIGVVVAAGLIAAYVFAVVTGNNKRDTFVNDRSEAVLVGTCDAPCDSTAEVRLVAPHGRWRVRTTDDYFVVRSTSGARIGCVDTSASPARASDAGAC